MSCFSLLNVACFILAHFILARLNRRLSRPVSPQLLLLSLAAFWNISLLVTAAFIFDPAGPELYAYLVIVFNCLAYSYFHFFNMSETARRVRLLVRLKLKPGDWNENDPGPEEMVLNRLARLVGLKQLTLSPDGRYFIRGRFFLRVSRLIDWWAGFTGARIDHAG